jgi:hypothetical protein
MTDYERCARCARNVDINSDEFTLGEATTDGQFICEKCLTPDEKQVLDEQLAEVSYEAEAWRFDA